LGDASLLGSMALEFVINFSIYPIGIYPALVRFLMYSLIPAAFITHIPLQMVHTSVASLLFLELAATILYSWFAYWFFHRGLRRYESGNLIVLRE
ncbi:MAG: ABC-2 family transporter protein, partial [Symbiobacteriaceae bacterium]|nr:ABC-2 family transporter protein [Symbiobacteriaceae bacterium]